jgi:hypothetical protein
MAINQPLFLHLQQAAAAEGRRMTLQEAESAGLPADDYHKLYGGPAVPVEAIQAQWGGQAPAQAFLEAGYSPGQVAQVTGLPQGATAAELVRMQQDKRSYWNAIAREGAPGSGVSVGTAREINPYMLGDAPTTEAAQIGPAALAGNVGLGDIERMDAATVEQLREAQASRLNDTALVPGSNEYRDQQLRLGTELEKAATGQSPSLAELQLKAATDRNNAQAQGLIASQRGVNSGLATRLAMNQTGDANQAAVQQGSQLRLAEAIAAREQLSQLSAQGRAQDFQIDATNQTAANQMSQKQGELDTSVSLANAQAANARAVQQAQLQQQAGQVNAQSANQRMVEQGDLDARLALANQLAQNTQSFQQAQLNQGANQVNAQLQQQQDIQRGQFATQSNIANQDSVNRQEIARAQTEAGIRQASISGGSSVAAAKAGAWGTVQSAQINADASILNNAMNNVNTLGQGQMQGGVQYGNTQQNTENVGTQNQTQVVGAVVGGVGTAAAASDRKLKKDISSADSEIKSWLDELSAKNYEYKEKKHGEGKKTGVMAQDLEKSPIGKSMVENTKDGKMVDFGKGLGAMLASLASINKRLGELEKSKHA